MQILLSPSDDISKQELIGFVQVRFPQAWEKASKMSKQEVEKMICEWRAAIDKNE